MGNYDEHQSAPRSVDPFDLQMFLPYMLAQVAEHSSRGFSQIYRDRYGMLRTDWRVMFHLGLFGPLTARDICARAGLHKTKVSRAVARLEEFRFLRRQTQSRDRRVEMLQLTGQGRSAYDHLYQVACNYEADITKDFSAKEITQLKLLLSRLNQTL